MRRKRRTRSPEFNAKVALAAIQGGADHGRTGQEIRCTRQSDHRLEEAVAEQCPDVFGNEAKKAEDATETTQELHAKIGQLTMENDFLERGLERIHGPRGKKW